jgi:hypothetical protein
MYEPFREGLDKAAAGHGDIAELYVDMQHFYLSAIE